MNIEIKNRNRIIDLIHNTFSKLEDCLFLVLLKLPDKLLPRFIIQWLNHYTTKRVNQLEQQLIKKRWQSMELQKARDELIKR